MGICATVLFRNEGVKLLSNGSANLCQCGHLDMSQ